MSNSFTQRALPTRSYGILMPVGTMKRVAKEGSAEKNPNSGHVDLIAQSLMRCRTGEADSNVLRLLLGMLNDVQLTLLEEAILALEDRQSSHEDWRSKTYPLHSEALPFDGADWGPFDHIVKASVPEFDEVALIALRDFSTIHHDLKDLTELCKIMNKEGIPLTRGNVEVQIVALIEATHNRRELFTFSHPYLSYPELIRAVHDNPEYFIELVDLQRTRGNVEAVNEVIGSAKAVSAGAL